MLCWKISATGADFREVFAVRTEDVLGNMTVDSRQDIVKEHPECTAFNVPHGLEL
jgi:hypothetical protein